MFAISERDAAAAAHSRARRSIYVENGADDKRSGVPEHDSSVRHCVRLCGHREYSRNVVRVIHRIMTVQLIDCSANGFVIVAVTVIVVIAVCGLNAGNVSAREVYVTRHLGVQNGGKQHGHRKAGQQYHAEACKYPRVLLPETSHAINSVSAFKALGWVCRVSVQKSKLVRDDE